MYVMSKYVAIQETLVQLLRLERNKWLFVLLCHLFLPNAEKKNILEKQLLMDSDKWFPVV